MKRIYLDYNASTPVDPMVLEEMMPFLTERFGNPSSSHSYGVACGAGLEQARERVATMLGCTASEIFFTSGATESNNMVLKGVLAGTEKGSHIITSSIEHPAVLEPCRYLAAQGYRVTYLPVDRHGLVNPDDLAQTIDSKTVLISIMHSNNEVGTIQPIPELARIAASRGIPFHTDAAQSVGKVRCRANELGVDFLTAAGHKLYAPKGVGALYRKLDRRLAPLLHGAGHEQGLRPGTENLASIVGLGKACEVAAPLLASEGKRQAGLGEHLFSGIRHAGFEVRLNGHPAVRLPNTWNISFGRYDSPTIMKALEGVAVSPGAACHGDTVKASHVLAAMGTDISFARGAVRFSLGRETTEKEINTVIELLKRRLKK